MSKKMIIGITALVFLVAIGGFGKENNEKASASSANKEVVKNDNSKEIEDKDKNKDESKEKETEDKKTKEKESKEEENEKESKDKKESKSEKKKSKEKESEERAAKKIEIFERLGKDCEPEYELPTVAKFFIRKHEDLFTTEDEDKVYKYINWDIFLKKFKKNGKVEEGLTSFYECKVNQIFENEVDGEILTTIYCWVEDGSEMCCIYYLGEVDVYEDDVIDCYGMLIANSSYENTIGGETLCTVMLGSMIKTQYDYEYSEDDYYEEDLAYENEYILYNSDTEYINKEDLEYLSKSELRLARNEIYARHGCIFKSSDLNEYFGEKSWYTPRIEVGKFSQNEFNKYELANIETIKSLE